MDAIMVDSRTYFGDSSNLYTGVCNVWSNTVSDLRETALLMEWSGKISTLLYQK